MPVPGTKALLATGLWHQHAEVQNCSGGGALGTNSRLEYNSEPIFYLMAFPYCPTPFPLKMKQQARRSERKGAVFLFTIDSYLPEKTAEMDLSWGELRGRQGDLGLQASTKSCISWTSMTSGKPAISELYSPFVSPLSRSSAHTRHGEAR